MSYWASGDGFLAILLIASIGPFVAPILPLALGSSGPVLQVLLAAGAFTVAVSNAHVFAMFYLLADRTQLRGVERPMSNLLAVPVTFTVLIVGMSVAYPTLALTLITLVVGFYGSYHFGRQNLGVHTFACRIANGRSMGRMERATIVAGIACPLVSGLGVALPTVVRLAGFDAVAVEPLSSTIRSLGSAGYVVLSGVVLWQIVRAWDQYDWRSLATYVIAVYFFLPGTLSPLFFGALVVAHGLQYMVFLAYHCLGAGQLEASRALHAGGRGAGARRVAATGVLKPLVVVTMWCLLGYGLSRLINAPPSIVTSEAFLVEYQQAISVLTALITSVTVSHYWIDQHLWRFRTPERRAWFSEYYRFLDGAAPRRSSAGSALAGATSASGGAASARDALGWAGQEHGREAAIVATTGVRTDPRQRNP
jgi:hypothetical protein